MDWSSKSSVCRLVWSKLRFAELRIIFRALQNRTHARAQMNRGAVRTWIVIEKRGAKLMTTSSGQYCFESGWQALTVENSDIFGEIWQMVCLNYNMKRFSRPKINLMLEVYMKIWSMRRILCLAVVQFVCCMIIYMRKIHVRLPGKALFFDIAWIMRCLDLDLHKTSCSHLDLFI